jgi:hypothetical protein
MPDYDTGFNPPAPVADLTINHPVTGAESGALRGKLDTGADVTVTRAIGRSTQSHAQRTDLDT